VNQQITKSSLNDPQRRLVEMLQNLNWGRIENLCVRGGEPTYEPAPRIIQTVKMGGQNGPRPEADLDEFWLKQPVIDLFQTIADLHEGKILVIEVKHGLPFAVQIERAPNG
jgi:hypothetical protein